jgi:hypothetical protein
MGKTHDLGEKKKIRLSRAIAVERKIWATPKSLKSLKAEISAPRIF